MRIHKFIFGTALLALCLLLGACMAGRKAKGPGAYAIEQDVPQILAVLPADVSKAREADPGDELNPEDVTFVSGLARSVLTNQLAGKGYRPLLTTAVDRKLHDHPGWEKMEPKALCKLLGAEGLVHVEVSGWSMVNAAAVENYMLSAGARMVSSSGREIGSWTETAEKQKISVPTSLLGLAGTLAGALLSDSPQKQFRHVSYDWGWKMAQIMPDCTQGQTLPEIMLVDSNVDVGTFGIGEKIAVKVFAEKDLVASFDIGTFRKNIALKPVGEGEYEGFYVVKEGERARGQQLTVHVARLNGAERDWVEPEALINVDGVRPRRPSSEQYKAQADGVHISWNAPGGEEIASFVVERNTSPVGDFAEVTRTEDAHYVDAEVEQGMAYYYRVRCMDKARNLSKPGKAREVIMPRFDEITISGPMTGTLITGNYRVEGEASVPAGETLTVMRGCKLTFADNARLDVSGSLDVKGDAAAPVFLVGDDQDKGDWLGIHVAEGGVAKFMEVVVSGAANVLTSAGRLLATGLDAVDGNGQAIVITGGAFELTDTDLSGWNKGLVVKGGEGFMAGSKVSGNKTGVAYVDGELGLDKNNIYDNAVNIAAAKSLAVKANYLGATKEKEARILGKVILKSVYDAPCPDGRLVTLMDDADLTAAQVAERFEQHRAKGIELFNNRKYGDAYVELTKAIRLKEDRDTYLYLVYTQMEMGETDRVEKTMDTALASFPYDFRLLQVQVRYLMTQGKEAKALETVDRALKMDPGNDNLRFLKEFVVDQSKQLQVEPSASSR